jgi:ABC-type Fe3+-hydroxamate transport system substrate-binding protein
MKRLMTIFGAILFASVILTSCGGGSSTANNSSSSSNEQTEQKTEAPKGVGVGEVLHTDYFDITVNKVSLKDRVNTGNQFADLKPEQGIKYLIINSSFKNTDQESRMLMDGSVWINYNGKKYEFDKSEYVMLEGWGLLLDQINPLTTKTTNLVYKIPAEIKGNAYWQPGRADGDQKIFLGNLE